MRRLLPLALALAAACTFPNRRHDLRVRDDLPPGGPEFYRAIYQSTGAEFRPGNDVQLVENGRVFDSMVEAVAQAKSSVHVVTYIWRPSPPSDRLLAAISERARAGVECRVLVDPVGSLRFERVRMQLSDAGCDVRYFRPVHDRNPIQLPMRNHRKAVILDGRTAIVGGFGIWKSWEGEGESPDHWRDTNLRVEGPVVREAQVAFAQDWQEAGGPLLPEECFPTLEPKGTAGAAFVASSINPDLSNAERMELLVIASARRRIWIANSYFIPSTAIGEMLIEKAKAGVDVRVLAPGRVHDWAIVREAQRSTYEKLLEAGVRIWEYQPSMMHAKTMIVDDRVAVVGSTNIDPLSLKWMEEGSLIVDDPRLVAEMDASYHVDLGRSMEIQVANWRRRSLSRRLAERLTSLAGLFL